MKSRDWKVFQTDVLDILRQYQGYFDFFERIGSLSDSRPDCFARVTRNEKKEVWILDAKNKSEIDSEDLKRMEKYVEMVKSNPVDVGLELTELSEHEVRGIFITSEKAEVQEYENIALPCLHQFLQKELIYTDAEKMVRDIAKMMEKKQLNHSQARLLFDSIKPFEKNVARGLEKLEELEEEFVGLKLDKPPLNSTKFNIKVDSVLSHSSREEVFLFDIPYSRRDIENIQDRVKEIRKRLEEFDKPVYYTVIDTFGYSESGYISQPGEVRNEVMDVASIVSPEELIELFTPKIPTEKEYGQNYIEVRDTKGLGIRTRVKTEDDIHHKIEVMMPKEVASSVENHFLNTREIGELQHNSLRVNIEVKEDLEIKYKQATESLESFRKSVRGLYQSAINPKIGRKASKTV